MISIKLIELIVNIYDIITLPIYYLIQKPWKVQQMATRVRARQVEPFTWVNIDNKLDKSDRKSIDTLDQLFRDSVSTYAHRNCLGVRKILAVEYKDSPQLNGHNISTTTTTLQNYNENNNKNNHHNHKSNGLVKQQANGVASKSTATATATTNTINNNNNNKDKIISKYVLDDKYSWFTYAQIENIVIKLSAGLVNLCSESLDNSDGSRKLLICADTCMEWFLIAHACFRNNITVVTAYTTLDDDAILHSIQQTEVKILVVGQKFAPRVRQILGEAPLVDTIIVLDEPLPGVRDERAPLRQLLGTSNIKQVISYGDLLARGAQTSERILGVPRADDIAVLMYTSGSTGKAKGVMLSHKSIVYTALAFSGPGDISHRDRYIGYLPLAHVLELAAECIFLRNGSTIAYSSPMTLTNSSPMIRAGQHGDAYIFKPTIMGAVPLVLDRIRSGLQQAIKSQGAFYDQLINGFVVRYKRYWWERYYDTPIMNRLICHRFNMLLGGQMRAICSGGAALSRDTQEYLRYVTNYTILQGYGLTETSAAASFCDVQDRRCNVVGAPYPIVRLRLESWSDYTVHDQPNPRGEIVIGGQPVSSGYYKMDELTRESFFVDDDGCRYFRTGDIGMMLPDGVLKIIDRKKDIVKPLSGEYICLSEIEGALRTAPVVENICVYCSQFSNYVVAIVKPDLGELRRLAKQLFNESSELGDNFRQLALKAYQAECSSHVHCDDDHQRQETSHIDSVVDDQDNHNDHDDEQSLLEKNGAPGNAKILDKLADETICSNKWLVQRVSELLQRQGAEKKLKRTQIPSKVSLVAEEWSPESGLVTASFKLRRREIERHYATEIKQLYALLGQNIDQDAK